MTTSTETPVKKISTSETGHYKNLANLSALIKSLKSYGQAYNPSTPDLSIASLESLGKRIDAAISRVSEAEIASRNTIRERQEAYEGMNALATRIQNAFAACASKSEEKNAMSYTKKIRGDGKRKADVITDEKSRSTSQMSFDNRMKSLKDFCAFLATIPAYNPNEADLQTKSIIAYTDSLGALNDNVNKTWNDLDAARAERDRLLYDKDSGANNLVQDIKHYVKSVFGVKSPEYDRISGIQFKQ